MEKYLISGISGSENPKPKQKGRAQWRRSAIELNGKLDSKYRHDLSPLLMQSYSEIGVFPHLYHIDGRACLTHMGTVINAAGGRDPPKMFVQGVSAVDFDNKGIYLVSVTTAGCLTVHDFETLYCQRSESLLCKNEDESKHLLHVYLQPQLDAVRWNQANQDEVVCISSKNDEALIFDIGYISSEPVEVLRTKRTLSALGSKVCKGLCDIATTDNSRLIASDTHGVVNVWDRRRGILPCLELTTSSRCTLNSIQPNVENQTILGAGKDGIIYVWDLRGGRTSAAFQCHNEVYNLPLASLTLASMLAKVESLKAQSDIVSKEIHSIDLNLCCPYQLAFHLDDGWSGVVDIYNRKITHVHCPPPAWLDVQNNSVDLLLRKPSWLPTSSMYVVGSASETGINVLDFYPDASSPCHVDYNEDMQSSTENQIIHQRKQNRFIPLSERVTACATHPLNGTIIAGTKLCSLLLVSQKKHSEFSNDTEDSEIKKEVEKLNTHNCT